MGWFCFCCAVLSVADETPIETPKPTDDRLVVELVAREPEIVTPTGIAVDERGRIWVIENQTHHRPADYKGPPGDRIRIYDDYGPDGRARRVTTFAEGFKNGMGLALAPNGDLYFATRSDIMILRDTDGDDVADSQDVIVKLDTAGDYPHNGLSGFAYDAFDNVYFGMGENLGAAYKLIGSDGTTLSGGGEGGNIYRCRPDGSKLVRVATGFWNPFHLTFDAFGRLFAVDNDPDSRPPCRLLHIISGGDYGYRFRNGRKGLHPFTAWNGELPGTLPMVAGTGEAPSGIVAYESDGLPDEYRGELIVTSWGDHVIQRFRLRDRGASFTSQAETLVRGGESFYPVGIAIAPDGSLVVSDWADKSYPLHGKGRIWRIRMKDPLPSDGISVASVRDRPAEQLWPLLGHPKQSIRKAATDALISPGHADSVQLRQFAWGEGKGDVVARMHALRALVKLDSKETFVALQTALRDQSPILRAEAIRLRVLTRPPGHDPNFYPTFQQIASLDPSPAVRLEATLALQSPMRMPPEANNFLVDNDPFIVSAALEAFASKDSSSAAGRLIRSADPKLRLGALLLLRRIGFENPKDRQLFLNAFLKDPDPAVRRAAIQWGAEEKVTEIESRLEQSALALPVTRELFEAYLAAKELFAGVSRKPTDEPSGEDFVAKILADTNQPPALRALALRTLHPEHAALSTSALRELLTSDDSGLRREVVRTLAARSDDGSQTILRQLTGNDLVEPAVRSWAVLGLGLSASTSTESRGALWQLLNHPDAKLQPEAIRSLRGTANNGDDANDLVEWWRKTSRLTAASDSEKKELAEQLRLALRPTLSQPTRDIPMDIDAVVGPLPSSEEEWMAQLANAGDAAAGEQVFFHPRGPQCSACHRVNGRGGEAGPDLSAIGRSFDREKIARSILSPSKDIAPQYTTWLIALNNGQVKSGIILREDPRGTITLGDAQGKTLEIPVAEIEQRQAQTQSIMPENLVDQMTRKEFRDLIKFLSELK